uniref:Uncharacterized protein n=1 Tax=Ascaris lumbricoides TaxID=6252 RepID=A0A0M3HS49_ASCLU
MPRALSGAGSSTPSEEGFVSGSSADEPSYVDRLAVDLGSFSISTNNSHGFSLFGVQQQPLQQKCSSESGASSGETDHSNMFLVHDITNVSARFIGAKRSVVIMHGFFLFPAFMHVRE